MIGRWRAARRRLYRPDAPPLRTTKDSRPALLRFPAVTSEEYMRTIAREEIAAREAEQGAAFAGIARRSYQQMRDLTEPAPDDGPLVSRVKSIMRGEDPA